MTAQHDRDNPELVQLRDRVEALERRLGRIDERNRRVELEKSWEVSNARVLLLLILTYLICSLVFWLIGAPYPLLNALIPTTGYYLSTLSLPLVRHWWIAHRRRRGPC